MGIEKGGAREVVVNERGELVAKSWGEFGKRWRYKFSLRVIHSKRNKDSQLCLASLSQHDLVSECSDLLKVEA